MADLYTVGDYIESQKVRLRQMASNIMIDAESQPEYVTRDHILAELSLELESLSIRVNTMRDEPKMKADAVCPHYQ